MWRVRFLLLIHLSSIIILSLRAQIVSHELRRLAVSTNQFGIDALRALDKLEPPDKVIVFNPICLTSSLSMVMMGSSKYQVVSSLRHALYVWPMKPQQINRAYRDLFDHIGMNLPLQVMMKLPKLSSNQTIRAERFHENFKQRSDPWWITVAKRAQEKLDVRNEDLGWYGSRRTNQLSLPGLVKVREYLAHSSSPSWWTLKDTRNSLDMQEAKSKLSMNQELRDMKSIQQDSTEFSQMNSLSSIYIQRGLNMNYNYNLLLRDYYRTVVHPVDFIRNGEETRQHINSLVASNTEGKVRDLMKKESFSPKRVPKALIVSTFHFRGTLDLQMKPMKNNVTIKRAKSQDTDQSNTVQKIKQEPEESKKQTRNFIETESSLLKYGQSKSLDCTVVEIPFNNRLISLVIVMPNNQNSRDLLLMKLSAQVLSDLMNSLTVKKISLEIPVIKFGRGPTNVAGLLRELSLNETFFGESDYATETGLNRWLRPEDIVHETSIDIGTINPNWAQTEDRLKVGAHTSDRMMFNRSITEEHDHLRLDKSFFYFITDSINGLVLTMGRIRQ